MDLTSLNKDKKQRRKPSLDLGTMVYGKVPPQAKPFEEAVLGAIMLEKGAFDIAAELLKPECFYVDAHQRIYKAMQSLANKSQPIDILTVEEQLKTSEELDLIGGIFYLTKLTNSVVSGANIEAHSQTIIEKFIQREIIRIGGEMISDAYEDSTDVFELLDSVETSVYNVSTNNAKKDFSPITSGLVKAIQRMEELRNNPQPIVGVPTGFPSMDSVLYGWQPTDLIILAARPSVGKTAFALNLARNAALNDTKPTPVGFFSLEMSESQLIQRMISAESEVWLERIRTGKMEDRHMEQVFKKGVQRLANAPIFIDDTAGLNMFELRAKARRMKNKHDIGLIIIDYLQLMTGDHNDSKNREREIAKISRELKKLAKDLQVPIIALSQLSREVEKRGKGQKVPQLSDLRESGAIEQDADIVMFLYRPPDDEVKEDADLKNKGMVKIAKNREGKLDEIVLKLHGEIMKWMELPDAERYERTMHGSFIPVPKEPKDFTQPNKNEIYLSKNKMEDDEDLPF